MTEDECNKIIYDGLIALVGAESIQDPTLNEVAKHLLNICNAYNKQSLKALADTIGTISIVLYNTFGIEGLQSIIEATEKNIQFSVKNERFN